MAGPSPEELSSELETVLSEYPTVPRDVVERMIRRESGGRADARSHKDAVGLMQLMPGTAAEMGVTDRLDWRQSLRGGVKYLAKNLETFGGSVPLAVAAYHAGPGNVVKAGYRIPDTNDGLMRTKDYVSEIAGPYLGGNPDDDRRVSAKPPGGAATGPSADFWAQYGPSVVAPPKPPPEKAPGLWSDTKNLLAGGADMAAQDFRELVRRGLGDTVVEKIDDLGTALGMKTPDELAEKHQAALSPQMREALDKKWWDAETNTPGDAWLDPRAYYGGLLQSLPEQALTMAPAMRVAGIVQGRVFGSALKAGLESGMTKEAAAQAAGKVAAASAERTAMLAGGIGEGSFAGAQSSREIRDAFDKMPEDRLEKSDAYQALLRQYGDSPEGRAQARAQLRDDASTQAFFATGFTTGAFGGVGDRVLARAIFRGLEGNFWKRMAKGALGEGVLEEFPQSYLQKVSENLAMQKVDSTIDTFDGALNAALGGLAVGAIQGAGQTAIFGRRAPDASTTPLGGDQNAAAAPPPDAPQTPPVAPPTAPVGDNTTPAAPPPPESATRAPKLQRPPESEISDAEVQKRMAATAKMQDGDSGHPSDGAPFATQTAAARSRRARGMDATHDVVPLGEDQFVLRAKAEPEEAQPAAAQSSDWMKQNIQAARELSDRLGLTDEIERLLAERKTVAQVRTALGPKLAAMPTGDHRGFLSLVRASLGIPSQEPGEEANAFAVWKAQYDARTKGTQTPPLSAPPAANAAADLQGALGGIGKAITGNLYDQLYGALAAGQTTMSGVKDPVLARAKAAFDAGLIKSPDDLRRFEKEGYPKVAPTEPVTVAPATPEAPGAPIPVPRLVDEQGRPLAATHPDRRAFAQEHGQDAARAVIEAQLAGQPITLQQAKARQDEERARRAAALAHEQSPEGRAQSEADNQAKVAAKQAEQNRAFAEGAPLEEGVYADPGTGLQRTVKKSPRGWIIFDENQKPIGSALDGNADEGAVGFVSSIRLGHFVKDGGVPAPAAPRMQPLFRPPPPPTELVDPGKPRAITNGTIQTATGRVIPVPPSIRTDTNRIATKDLKGVDAWLLEQGQAEAAARGDDFVATQFKGLDPKRLSQGDKDALNEYLFGETNPTFTPAEAPSRPQVGPEQGAPTTAAAPPGEGFDPVAFDKKRADTIKASKAAGNRHLDDEKFPAVETMRGKAIYYAHDPKVRGVIRTVDNRGNVYVNWSDEYSAKAELATASEEGTGKRKRTVFQTSLGPSDLKDYVFAGAQQAAPKKSAKEALEAARKKKPAPAKAAELTKERAREIAKQVVAETDIDDTYDGGWTPASKEYSNTYGTINGKAGTIAVQNEAMTQKFKFKIAELRDAPPGKQKPVYGQSNKVFTEDAAEKARELLRKKLGQLNAGVDPEVLQAGLTLAGYHIEAGARAFADYTKAMIGDLGEAARPFLRSWYESVRHYPGFDAKGMSSAEEIDAPAEEAADDSDQGASPAETKAIAKEFKDADQPDEGGEWSPHRLFAPPAPSEVVRIQDKVRVYTKQHGWMTPAEAKKKIGEWAAHAAKQGERGANNENRNKTVLSLFDYTGAWSQPWEDAGYNVWRFDIQNDPEAGDVHNFSVEFMADWFADFEGQDIYAILAACPCTDFASSGARHFAAKDKDGRTVSSVDLVQKTRATIEYYKPSVWAIENPVGRIEKLTGLPPWRMSFDPNHFGETYTKKTLLWGRFNADLPIAPVEPTEGSKMHSQYGGKSQATKNARSVTPEGFAYSFFMANNAADHPVMAISNKYDRLDPKAIKAAVDAGLTEDQIKELVDDPYYIDLDDNAANAALYKAAGKTPPEPRGPAPKTAAPDDRVGTAAAPLKFSSGMSRPGDFKAALAADHSIGIDINELSVKAMPEIAKALIDSPTARIFVDTGAFSLFRAQLRAQERKQKFGPLFEGQPKGIDWQQLFKKLDKFQIALSQASEDTGGDAAFRVHWVMPDIVGNQKASLDLLEQHKDDVHGHVAFGNAIVPLQQGELTLTEAFDRAAKIIGRDDFMVGIPSNERAVDDAQFRAFLRERGDRVWGIHILGAASDKKLAPRLAAMVDEKFDGEVSADANRLRSLMWGSTDRAEAMRKLLGEDPAAKERSPKQKANDERMRRKAAGRRHINEESDSLIPAIIKTGSINEKYRKDVTGDTKGSNPRLPFVGTLFQKNGRGLDEIARELGPLNGYGYLGQADEDSTDGGVARLVDLIQKELAGDPQYSTARDMDAVRDAMAEREQEAQLEQEAIAAAADAGDPFASLAAPDDLMGLDELDPQSAEDLASADLVAQAAAINESAVERLAQQYAEDEAGFMAAIRTFLKDHENEQSQGIAAGGAASNPAPAEAGSGVQAEAEYTLAGQTQAEILAAEQAAKDAADRKAAEAKAAEDKARADAELPGFTLSGSNRPADVMAAQGQGGLFESPSAAPPATGANSDAALLADGYKRTGEYFDKDGKPTMGYAMHAVGDRVRHKENGAIGTVEDLVGAGPIRSTYIVNFPLGNQRVSDAAIEAAPEQPKGDTDATLARFRPKQMVVFSKPYVGKTGAKLVGYEWKWTMEHIVDARGEDRDVRMSDWEESVTNPETNRDIVHQFQIERTDGSVDLVSAETAARLLGIAESTVRSSAKRLLREEMRKQQEAAAKIAQADAFDAMEAKPTPAAAVETGETNYAEFVRKRTIAQGKGWGGQENARYYAELKYRFLTRDGKFIWTPDLVEGDRDGHGSEMARRGWRTVELRADQIWDAKGNDVKAPAKPAESEQPSDEYQRIHAEASAATKTFREVTRKYRAREIGDTEFLAAKKEYEDVQRRFGEAYAKEAEAGRNPKDERGMPPLETPKEGQAALFDTSAPAANSLDDVLLAGVTKKIEEGGGSAAIKNLPGGEDAVYRLIDKGWLVDVGSGYVALPKTASAARKMAGTTNVEDVGENLWYNRRNFARGGVAWDDIKDKNAALKKLEVQKPKVWPRPDYEALVADGMNPLVARMVKQVYDGIATAPAKADDASLQAYIAAVQKVRDGLLAWAKDDAAVAEFGRLGAEAVGKRLRNPFAFVGGLRDIIVDRIWPAASEADDRTKSYRFRDGVPRDDILALGGRRALTGLQIDIDDLTKATKEINDGWPAKQEAWQKRFEVRQDEVRGEDVPDGTAGEPQKRWMVYSKGSRWRLASREHPKHGFATQDDAVEYARGLTKRERDESGQDIRGTNVGDAERTGPPRREEGQNISSDTLSETFGFRGVNFGRKGWIGDAERQAYLNAAYDGLLDLADILGVPPKALSLNGMLGIAFGAQGRGGNAAAHFVPGVNEINLTKTMGSGTLAHEWGHALDHHFARLAGLEGDTEPFLSAHANLPATRQRYDAAQKRSVTLDRFGPELRPEMRAAFTEVYQAMHKRPQTPEEAAAMLAQGKASAEKRLEQWLDAIRGNMGIKGAKDEAEFNKLADRIRAVDMGDGYVKSGNLSLSPVLAELREMSKRLRGKHEIKSNMEGLANAASSVDYYRTKGEADASHEPQRVSTKFYAQSAAKDRDKGGKRYWATPWEMFARSFELYVADRLAEREQSNTFLSDAQQREQATDREGGPSFPYPRNEDRAAVNAAIGKLVGAIETRATDSGIELHSLDKRAVGFPRAAGEPIASLPYDAATYKASPYFLPAKSGDIDAAIKFVRGMVAPSTVTEAKRRFGSGVIYVAGTAEEATGRNAIPDALAAYYADATGAAVDTEIVQSNAVHHTGESMMGRMLNRALFDGRVQPGARYVLVDDVTTSGNSFAELADHILAGGGEIAGGIVLADARRGGSIHPARSVIDELTRRFGDAIREIFHIEPAALTGQEAGYLIGFRSADAIRDRAVAAAQERRARLAAKGISERAPSVGAIVPTRAPANAGVSVSGAPHISRWRAESDGPAGDRTHYAVRDNSGKPTGVERRDFKTAADAREFAARENSRPIDLDALDKPEPPPVWRSALQDALPKAPWSKAGDIEAAQLARWLEARAKDGTLKKDELEWSGLPEWLAMQKGRATRAQVEAYLDQNGVKVTETVLGGKPGLEGRFGPMTIRFEQDPGAPDGVGDWTILDGDEVLEEVYATAHDALQARDEYLQNERENDGAPRDNAKFAGYQLPGGENYRELLLTLPPRKPAPKKYSSVEAWLVEQPWHQSWRAKGGDMMEAIRLYDQWKAREENNTEASFRSSHFDQPNILAHIRFNERTDAEGRRVLFIEEIQSDWAQKGRKEGFGEEQFTIREVRRAELPKAERNSFVGDPDVLYEAIGRDGRRLYISSNRANTEEKARRNVHRGIPAAPFVAKTEAWVALALKRMIRYAADNGFDRIAWTNGEQQADRYDLSKQVDSIRAAKKVDGSGYSITATRNGERVISRNVEESGLAELVGKDLAEKIIKGEGGEVDSFSGARVYSGVDLKVGGEGMRAFYDRIVPNVANDILKKMGGGKVGRIEGVARNGIMGQIYEGPELTADELRALYAPNLDGWSVTLVAQARDVRGEMLDYDRSFAAAMAKHGSAALAEKVGGRMKQDERVGSQPGFDITDAMRQIAGQGLPMFAPDRIEGVLAGTEQTPAFQSFTQRTINRIERLQEAGDGEAARAEIVKLLKTKKNVPAIRAREKLQDAVTAGQLDPQNAALAIWLLERAPHLANGTDFEIRPGGEGSPAGSYNRIARLITLASGRKENGQFRGDHLTATHEFMHHAERMMPEEVQEGIRNEWARRLMDFQSWGQDVNSAVARRALADTLLTNAGDVDAQRRVKQMILDGELPMDFYQLTNPSEFWAENSSRILNDQAFAEQHGWVAKARQWLEELIERIKDLLGLPSDAPVLRGLRAVIDGTGEQQTHRMIYDDKSNRALVRSRQDVYQQIDRPDDTPAPIRAALRAQVVTDAPHRFANRLRDLRGVGLQALGRRQITDIYGDDIPALREYNELAQQMDADKNEAGADADKLVRDWAKLPDEKQLADLMHDATLSGVDPDKLGSNSKWKGLKDRFDALTPEAKAVYRRARDMYEDHYNAVQAEIKKKVKRVLPDNQRRAELLERMDANLFGKIKGVYFPLARFGDYLVSVKDQLGRQESVSMAETLTEAEAMRAHLLAKFPPEQGYTVTRIIKRQEYNAARDSVGRAFLQDLYGVLDQHFKSDAERAEIQDSINQLYLSSLPDLSWAKHGIHRKGTPGFSQDARRAYAQNMFHGARYLAKMRYSDRLADWLRDMQETVTAGANDPKFDNIGGQQVVDEMHKRHDLLMNPNTSQLATNLTSLGFVFHLGLSPASAMVNVLQTPMVAYPILAAKYGWGQAGRALMAASRLTAANTNDLQGKLKGDEAKAYDEAVRSGVIDVTLAHDLAGVASGEDTKAYWKLRPVMRAASFLFHHAEKFNRQATFLAAYRLARAKGLAHDAAYKSAAEDTYAGHFDYSAGNRPRVMQGNAARVILLFKQFGQNMIYTIARAAYKAAHGDREAAKALAGILTTHALGAGILGLPFVTTLLAVASMIGSDDDDPWDAQVALRNLLADSFGREAGEVLAHGLSRLTPWDISARVGLNNMIFPDIREGLEGQDLAKEIALGALGPVAGIGTNVLSGLKDIGNGNIARGIEGMAPAALRGPMRAARFASEGVKDRTGIEILKDVTPMEEFGQALGFSPGRVKEATEGRSAEYQAERALNERRRALLTQWAHAKQASDEEGVLDALNDIRAFNLRNPSRKITGDNLADSMRLRTKRQKEAEHGLYLPKKHRDVRELGRFAATE